MKILYFDLETTPIKGYTWGLWQQNVIEVIEDWQIICFSYKWEGDKKVTFVRGDKKDPWDDKEMIKTLWDLFNEADVLIAHNLYKFDLKRSNSMFLRHGLTPPSPCKYIDTLRVGKQTFGQSSHALNAYAKELLDIEKEKHGGYMDLFKGCMIRDKAKDWRIMKKYCNRDVVILQSIYKLIRPWMKNHPINLDKPNGCTKCGSDRVYRKGFRETAVSRYARYRCSDCGGWMRGTKKEDIKPKYRNA